MANLKIMGIPTLTLVVLVRMGIIVCRHLRRKSLSFRCRLPSKSGISPIKMKS
jgi:hypothetical protein